MGGVNDSVIQDHQRGQHGDLKPTICGLCFPEYRGDARGQREEVKSRAIFRSGMTLGWEGHDPDKIYDILEELYLVGYTSALAQLVEGSMETTPDPS